MTDPYDNLDKSQRCCAQLKWVTHCLILYLWNSQSQKSKVTSGCRMLGMRVADDSGVVHRAVLWRKISDTLICVLVTGMVNTNLHLL